jgi:hypothetical protein
MTVHAPKLLTPEEFASLIEIAVTSPDPNIPAAHLTKLIALGYVLLTAKGPVVTGDGLIRITESEWRLAIRSQDKWPPRVMTGWNSLGPAMNLSFNNWARPLLLCWDGLSFQSQTGILDQANDIIGLAPMPEARNEIVKLLLRHWTQGFKQ